MKNLIITDRNNYTNPNQQILYINKYCKNLKDFSILNFIEDNSDLIKKEFKEDLKKLLNNLQKDKRFNVKKKYNLFYNFFLFDRSIYKYASINEYLKIVAIKKFFEKKQNFSVNLKIKNKNLLICIKKILLDKKIEFKEKGINISIKINFLNFFLNIFRIIKFIFKRLFLKSPSKKIINKKNSIISYLAYIDKKHLNKNDLKTIYWADIFSDKKNNFFFYIYNENSEKNLSKIYEIEKKKDSNFIILDSILGLSDFFIIFFNWAKLVFNYYLKKKLLIFHFNNMNNSFKLFYDDIYNSTYGFDSFLNIYYSYLFEKLCKQKFRSQKTFYTSENQGWEKSFNYFFKNKTKKIYAVISTPVRYWDTRYLDENNFIIGKNKKKYLPDFYAVNGKISEKNLIKNNYSKKKIYQVEALRYKVKNKKYTRKEKKNFLVAGDYNLDVNQKLEEIIIQLSKIYKKEIFYIKQHPNLKFGERLKNIKNCIFVEDKDISELSNYCGKAIIPNMTSASIDAVLNDLKTVVLYADGQVNFSPLKDVKEILHEKDEKIIIKYFKKKLDKKINKNYFLNFNSNNKLWKKII